jgi:hypothetical protein
MTLPRFTSGKVGNLDFSHLNEAFGVIDGLDRTSGLSRRVRKMPNIVVARLGNQDQSPEGFGAWAWTEVYWNFGGDLAVTVPGGLTSGSPAGEPNPNPYLLPAVSLEPTAFRTGEVVLLVPSHRARFNAAPESIMLIVRTLPSVTRAFEIVNAVGISLGRWRYIGRERRWDGVNNAWVAAEVNDQDVNLLNSVENAVDTPGNIGVGSTLPGSVPQPVRQRIKNGTVVMATASNAFYVFSVPNGYAFQCP